MQGLHIVERLVIQSDAFGLGNQLMWVLLALVQITLVRITEPYQQAACVRSTDAGVEHQFERLLGPPHNASGS